MVPWVTGGNAALASAAGSGAGGDSGGAWGGTGSRGGNAGRVDGPGPQQGDESRHSGPLVDAAAAALQVAAARDGAATAEERRLGLESLEAQAIQKRVMAPLGARAACCLGHENSELPGHPLRCCERSAAQQACQRLPGSCLHVARLPSSATRHR
jgi:hypothetical protein